MTLQHEARFPKPLGIQPDLARALQLVIREIEQTLIPDLQSERSRTTAGMCSAILRHLTVRQTTQDERLESWTAHYHQLLAEIGQTPDSTGGSAFERYQAATGLLAGLMAGRAAVDGNTVESGLSDDWARRVVRFEREQALEQLRVERELSYLQHAPERVAQLELTPQRLQDYLASRWPEAGTWEVSAIHRLLGGFSKETFIVEATAGTTAYPLVLRRDISLGPVAGSVVDEVPLLKALHGLGLSVPEALLAEHDRSIFGEAFSLTRKVAGETAFSNVKGLNMVGDQAQAARALAQILGRLHAVDAGKLGLPSSFYDPSNSMSDCVLREISHYEDAWNARSSQASPTMSAVFAWLRANLPASGGTPCIVHGDAGLHNLMMDGEQASAMLDWELSHMGDPAEDLAYCRNWTDQTLPWDEFLSIYYANGGRPYRPELERYYRVLANLRVVVFAAQSGYGSQWSEHPQATLMFATTHYHAVFLEKVAEQLAG